MMAVDKTYRRQDKLLVSSGSTLRVERGGFTLLNHGLEDLKLLDLVLRIWRGKRLISQLEEWVDVLKRRYARCCCSPMVRYVPLSLQSAITPKSSNSSFCEVAAR
jgi:hypothetical protein